MKTIIRNSDNVAVYVGDNLTLTGEGLRGLNWIDPSLTTDTATVYDLALPEGFVVGAYAYDGQWSVVHQDLIDALDAEIVARQAAVVAAFISKIDADVDAIYAFAVGNRTTEYQKAEAQARAYRATGYEGVVPQAVASWVKATGKSAQWAADDIIETADAWHAAEDTIRDVRLACKEAARNAKTETELTEVRNQWSAFVTQMRAQLSK